MGMGYVAVGIRLAPYPPHGSGRAAFPHPALASGGDAQAARRIGMADTGRRQPAVNEPFHSLRKRRSKAVLTGAVDYAA